MNKKINLLPLALLLLCLSAAQVELRAQTQLDSLLQAAGMVDIQSLDSSIVVDLRYASTNNFVGENLYGDLKRAYLEPSFAKRIAEAQRRLRVSHPGHSLIVFDAARPLSVQRRMRRAVEGTAYRAYVAGGRLGGRHNYGVAVDLSIVDDEGKELDMGSPFDHFGPSSHLDNDELLLRKGLISKEAKANRALLRSLMRSVGLRPYIKEWWHYQEAMSIGETRKRYKLLDF